MRFLRCLLNGVLLSGVIVSTANAQSVIRNSPHYEEMPGCRDLVYKAMEGIAYQNVIRDVQAAEELILKPESVFRMTCFSRGLRSARAQAKVRVFTQDYLGKNYQNNLIGLKVTEDCAAIGNLWDYLTGNGAVRWRLYADGSPRDLRPDAMYYYDTAGVWTNNIADARSINAQSGSILNAVSDAEITALEDELDTRINLKF